MNKTWNLSQEVVFFFWQAKLIEKYALKVHIFKSTAFS